MKKSINNILISIIILIMLLINLFISNTLVKSTTGFILMYFSILGFALYSKRKYRKELIETIPFSFMVIILSLIVFGIFNLLKFGSFVIFVFGIILFIYDLHKNPYKQNIFKDRGLIFYTILYVGFFIADYFACFNTWDEYTFWSISSKNYYYSDTLNFTKLNTMPYNISVWYPPCPTILQYHFMKIFGQYRQGFELFALQIMSISFLLPFFKNSKNKIQSIAISVICLAITAIFADSLFYYTIYVDCLLGLLTGYGLILTTEKDDKFYKLSLLLLIITLTFTKSSGFMFSFSVILFYFINNIIETINKKENILSVFKNKYLYALSLCLLIPFIGWRLYCNNTNVINNYVSLDSNMELTEEQKSIGSIKNVISSTVGAVTGYNYDLFSKSINNFYSDMLDKTYYSNYPIGLSSMNWIIIFIIMLLLLSKYGNKNDVESKYKYCISLTTSIIAYILLLQLSYLLMFSATEAIKHNSAQRYIGSILISGLIFIIYIYLKEFNNNKSKNINYILLTCIVLFFTPIKPIADGTINSGSRNWNNISYLKFEKDLAEKVVNNVPDDKKLLVINQNENSNSLLKIIYFATPYKISNTVKITKDIYEYNNYENIIKNSDYLLIVNKDKFIEKKLKNIFNIDIQEWSIYKIENNKLVLIDKTKKTY